MANAVARPTAFQIGIIHQADRRNTAASTTSVPVRAQARLSLSKAAPSCVFKTVGTAESARIAKMGQPCAKAAPNDDISGLEIAAQSKAGGTVASKPNARFQR